MDRAAHVPQRAGHRASLKNHGDAGVVTRETLLRAVQFHDFPGAGSPRRRVSAPVARDVAHALKALGLRPRKGKLFAGPYA